MEKMKRFAMLFMVLTLCAGLCVPAYAGVEGGELTDTVEAWAVYASTPDNATVTPGMAVVGENNTLCICGGTTYVVDDSGTLWSWGRRLHVDPYLLMPAISDARNYDRTKEPFTDVRSVASNESSIFVLKNDNSLWVSGNNVYGSLGLGINSDSHTGIFGDGGPVMLMKDVAAVCAGGGRAAAIKTDGSLWVWGVSSNGTLGNGTEGNDHFYYIVGGGLADGGPIQTTPCKIMDDVTAAYMYTGISAAVKKDGSLWVWGVVQTRDGAKVFDTPVKVMDGVKKVGHYFDDTISGLTSTQVTVAAYKTDGSLWVVGQKDKKQDGSPIDAQYTPEGIAVMKVLDDAELAVDCGLANAVIKSDGSLWARGFNINLSKRNFFGDPKRTESIVKDYVKIMDDVSDIQLCWYHSDKVINFDYTVLAVKKDGSLWCLMSEGSGRFLGDETLDPTAVPVKLMDNVLLRTAASAAADNTFLDVPDSAYYAEAVKWAVENEITNGVGGGKFGSEITVTRAQAVTFLWRAMGKPAPAAGATQFSDVKAGDYYADAVKWAVEKGITNGMGNNQFLPDLPVTRGQMITFLYRTEGEPDKTDGGAWYENAVNWANANDLLTGTAEAFSVEGACPRSDVINYMFRDMAQ